MDNNVGILMMRVIATASICFSAMSCGGKSDEPVPYVLDGQSAMEFAMGMGAGWNLGNSLDAHAHGVSNETCWGNAKATQKTFDAVKAMGFGCVRIPVTWMGHIGPAPEYKVDDAWMNRVVEIALYAKKAGLKAIINVHHDGADSNYWLSLKDAAASEAANAAIRQRYAALWRQIATRFRNEGDWLIFETMNEVHDGNWGNGDNLHDGGHQYSVINGWNQLAVNTIRSVGGENASRYIAVTGIAAGVTLTANNLVLPTDSAKNRLLVAVHSYDPWDYAGAGKFDEWGHTGTAGRMAPKSRELDYTILLDRLVNTYIKKGVPVYMGECGCVHRSDLRAEKFRKYYIEYTVKAMRDRGIVPIIWDNGSKGSGEEAFGLVNHGDGSFINNAEEIVKLVTGTWNNDNPAYTLDAVYRKAPL